jgi:hypothetical protein
MPFMTQFQTSLLFIPLLYSLTAIGQNNKGNEYLLSFIDTAKSECGYKNQNGDTVIRPGNYDFCFTDTFRTYAIVSKQNLEFIAIDRRQNILYNVFPFDNGPDYISDGLFRIIRNNKIGYANAATGKVIIKPQFSCALPFENGLAKVSTNCVTHSNEEHNVWTTENWFYIDKKGKKLKSKVQKNDKE